MRITTISFLMAALLATIGTSQKDILYYKFDAIGAKKAINYASGSGIAPAEGRFLGTTSKWAPGKFGGSLMGASNALPDDNLCIITDTARQRLDCPLHLAISAAIRHSEQLANAHPV